MGEQIEASGPAEAATAWRWLWGLAVTTALLGLVLGPAVVVLLGAGLLGGGWWIRREAVTSRDRAMAGGVAAAGAAILVMTGLVLLFLMPVSVGVDASPEPVVVEEAAG
jgi:hypothetical protein